MAANLELRHASKLALIQDHKLGTSQPSPEIRVFKPVSYTHLDVYKRQVLTTDGASPLNTVRSRMVRYCYKVREGMRAVSYTHLDVYKRQYLLHVWTLYTHDND